MSIPPIKYIAVAEMPVDIAFTIALSPTFTTSF